MNTIGTVRVAASIGGSAEVPLTRMTSGASATSSAACRRIVSASPGPSGSRCERCGRRSSPPAAVPAERCEAGLRFRIVYGGTMSTPMRRTRSGCCARAASGHDSRAAEQRDELAPLHSITSSARASSDGGTVEAEHPGGLGVDDQLELARLHDRQVRGLGALEDAARV